MVLLLGFILKQKIFGNDLFETSFGIQFFHSTMKTHKNINVVRTTVEKEWHWSAYETCLSTILYKKDNCGIRENEEQYFVTKTRRYEYQYHRTKWKIGFFFFKWWLCLCVDTKLKILKSCGSQTIINSTTVLFLV